MHSMYNKEIKLMGVVKVTLMATQDLQFHYWYWNISVTNQHHNMW
jgi:hypothetical protein